MLPKYCIGDLAPEPGDAPATTYEADLGEGQFYHTLKKRVDAYFKDNKARLQRLIPDTRRVQLRLTAVEPRSWTRARTPPCLSSRRASCSPWLCPGSAPSSRSPAASRCDPSWLVGRTAALQTGADSGLRGQLSLLCAVVLGAMKAEVGVSIMHDANHGAYSRSTRFARLMGATLDVAGASRCARGQFGTCSSQRSRCCSQKPGARSFMWRQQHVVGHHAFTNVDGLDPDIRVSGKDVRRVTATQPWHAWHALQHVYLGAMYSLLAFKSIYVDDFASLAGGSIGPVSLAPLTRTEAAVFWGGKAAYACYMLVAPALWSHHSALRLLALWALTDAVTGWMLAFMFQVAHVVDDVAYPVRDPATGRVPLGWAAAQMATTADFCHGSAFWTHVSGGLNYQVCSSCNAGYVGLGGLTHDVRSGGAPPVPWHLPLPLPGAGADCDAHSRRVWRALQGVPHIHRRARGALPPVAQRGLGQAGRAVAGHRRVTPPRQLLILSCSSYPTVIRLCSCTPRAHCLPNTGAFACTLASTFRYSTASCSLCAPAAGGPFSGSGSTSMTLVGRFVPPAAPSASLDGT